MSGLSLSLSMDLDASRRAPLVNYNFTTGTVPAGVTGAGGANGTAVNASALIAAATAPRLDYLTGTACLLVEPAATNLVFPSATFTGTGWNKNGSTNTTAAGTAPDGANTASQIQANAGSINRATYKQNGSVTTVQTNSVFAKAGTVSWLGLAFDTNAQTDGAFFDLQNGVVGTVASGCTATITSYGNGWYRCTVKRTYTSAAHFFTMEIHSANNQSPTWTAAGTETILIWGGQSEAASVATSHITTTAAALTRTADADSFTIPSGVATLRFTFDDNSTQDVAVSAGSYTIPTNLNRSRIKRIVSI